MMASVVSSGTGTVLRNTPGGPVRGKTGTAEHGNDPAALPRTWFAGYQRDVAFAVLVEEGKSGGTVAAPVAKKFLTDLHRRLTARTRAPDRTAEGPARRTGRGLRRRLGGPGSDGADLVGLRALGALGDLELDPLGLVERAVALVVDGGVVNEHVGAAAVLGDETEALLSVEPLHGALCHGGNSFFDSQWSPHLARPRLPHYPHNYRDMPVR